MENVKKLKCLCACVCMCNITETSLCRKVAMEKVIAAQTASYSCGSHSGGVVSMDLVGLWERSWQPVRLVGEVWVQLLQPLGKHGEGLPDPGCVARLKLYLSTLFTSVRLIWCWCVCMCVCESWGGGAGGCSWTLRTGFHRLSAAVRLDQKRSGDITWLAINGILAGAKTQSKHAESPSVSVWGDVSHIVSRNPAENANRLGEVIKAPFFSSSFQEVLIWFWLSVNF